MNLCCTNDKKKLNIDHVAAIPAIYYDTKTTFQNRLFVTFLGMWLME